MRTLVSAVRPGPGERARLALSVLLSAGATGAAIALLATSGYLISRAAQRPLIITLMVLDEPVAHLDAPLARRVMRRVLDHAGGRGVLVITHATDTLDGFDRVLRLDGGTVRAVRTVSAAADSA